MKIAMVSEHASPLAVLGGADAGGQNVHVAELSTALSRMGHEVVVYTRRDCPDLPVQVPLIDGVVVEHLDAGPPTALPKDEIAPHVPELASELTARLSTDPPDVIHAHFWMSGLAALGAATVVQRPVVHTFHALGVVKRRHQQAADTSPVNRVRHEKVIANHATRVLASSTDERGELLRMGVDAARIDIVPSGVDLARFRPDGPQWPRTSRCRLVTVSRLVPRKGVDDAIRIVADLPDTELLIAGGPEGGAFDDDAEVTRLRALAADLGAADRVRLLGSIERSDLAGLIRSADAVLCLPWYEPFGIVPLEAMACGVPVVASAVGGLLDTVVNGVTGLHVPPRNPVAAVRAVHALLADGGRRARMGAAGVRRAKRYDWAEVAATVERSYLDALVSGDVAQRREAAG